MRKGLVAMAVGTVVGGLLIAVPLLTGGVAAGDEGASVVESAVVGAPVDAETGDRYVAFGDSFVAGDGVKPQRAGVCNRSENNFPSQVAAAFDVADFIDASCSGARTTHLTEAQERNGGANPPQLDSLDAGTTLITFGTLGGNDMGLVNLAIACLGAAVCEPGTPGDDTALAGIETARTNMVAGLRAAQETSPDAEIYVVGYGTYLPAGGCTALQGLGITPDEADYIQSRIDLLSDMLAEVAGEEDAVFVDLRDTPNNLAHTACAEPEQQWIRTVNTYDDGVTFHPSYCGHVAMGQQVANVVREARGEAEVPFDDSCSGFGAPVEPEEPTEPEGPSEAERRAALKKAWKTTSLTTRCRAGVLKARVKGGRKQVVRVEFRVGKRTVGVDRSAPFTVAKKAKKVAKHKGKVKAVIRVRDKQLRFEKVRKAKRPACLRK